MERDADKISGLKKELGRYRKKVDDQMRVENQLRGELHAARRGAEETGRLVDAVLAVTAVQYGETVRDEETGDIIGFRLTLPPFRAAETLERYRISARKDEATGDYVVGVMEREKGG